LETGANNKCPNPTQIMNRGSSFPGFKC